MSYFHILDKSECKMFELFNYFYKKYLFILGTLLWESFSRFNATEFILIISEKKPFSYFSKVLC